MNKVLVAALSVALMVLGATLASVLYWSPRLNLAIEQRDRAQERADLHRSSAAECAEGAAQQRDAIRDLLDTLAKSEAEAAAARAEAEKARSDSEGKAQRVMAETDPVGASECAAAKAAQAAFDVELAKERGQ